jgi:hypothetical protein
MLSAKVVFRILKLRVYLKTALVRKDAKSEYTSAKKIWGIRLEPSAS